jgi:hypothetical protein
MSSYTVFDMSVPSNVTSRIKIGDFVQKGSFAVYPITDLNGGKCYMRFPGMFSFGVQDKLFEGARTGKLQMAFAIGKRGQPGGKATYTAEEQAILANFEEIEEFMYQWIEDNADKIAADSSLDPEHAGKRTGLRELLELKAYRKAMFELVFRAHKRPGREHEACFLYTLLKSYPKKANEIPGGDFSKVRSDPSYYNYGSRVYYPGGKEMDPVELSEKDGSEKYCTAYPSLVIEGITMGRKRLTFNMTINDVSIAPQDRSGVTIAPRLPATQASSHNPDEYGTDPVSHEDEEDTTCSILGD